MTTLLSVYSRERCLGTCNANCYDGKNPTELHDKNEHFPCRCICGGSNHAVGLSKALRNINERGVGLRRSDLEFYAQERGLNPDDLMVVDRTRVHSDYTARRMARARFHAEPLGPDDLFYCCEASADAGGPAAGGPSSEVFQTPDQPPGEPAGPMVFSRR